MGYQVNYANKHYNIPKERAKRGARKQFAAHTHTTPTLGRSLNATALLQPQNILYYESLFPLIL